MNILLAVQEKSMEMDLKKRLTGLGHHITAIPDGGRAWEIFQECRARMVIMDWHLPGLNAADFCEKIHSNRNENYTYIIVVMENACQSSIMEAYQAGADDHACMALDTEGLAAKIKSGERLLQMEEEHKKLIGQLINSRNKFRIVFDALDEEIVLIDSEYHIISINETFIKNRNMTYRDAIGALCFDKNNDPEHGLILPSVIKYAEKVFASGKPQNHLDETDVSKEDKEYRKVSCIPVKSEKGITEQVVIVSRDVTEEIKQAEQIKTLNKDLVETLDRLKQTQGQMLQSEKMASIGQLAAGVAHEINNPTGFVNSNLKTLSDYQDDLTLLIQKYNGLLDELSKEKLPEIVNQMTKDIAAYQSEIDIEFIQEDVSDLIQDCQEGMERIKKIVRNMKDFAHPGESKMQEADINKGLESTLNVVWNELKYKATVKKEFGDLPPIRCFPQELNQVFMNLLVNAAHAIDKKGEIYIQTQWVNNHIQILIQDTGSGIPGENLTKIFDPFFTTKDVGKGTGLGLNMAYNIIEKHNGTIEVESEVGKGTTFRIKIPAGIHKT